MSEQKESAGLIAEIEAFLESKLRFPQWYNKSRRNRQIFKHLPQLRQAVIKELADYGYIMIRSELDDMGHRRQVDKIIYRDDVHDGKVILAISSTVAQGVPTINRGFPESEEDTIDLELAHVAIWLTILLDNQGGFDLDHDSFQLK